MPPQAQYEHKPRVTADTEWRRKKNEAGRRRVQRQSCKPRCGQNYWAPRWLLPWQRMSLCALLCGPLPLFHHFFSPQHCVLAGGLGPSWSLPAPGGNGLWGPCHPGLGHQLRHRGFLTDPPCGIGTSVPQTAQRPPLRLGPVPRQDYLQFVRWLFHDRTVARALQHPRLLRGLWLVAEYNQFKRGHGDPGGVKVVLLYPGGTHVSHTRQSQRLLRVLAQIPHNGKTIYCSRIKRNVPERIWQNDETSLWYQNDVTKKAHMVIIMLLTHYLFEICNGACRLAVIGCDYLYYPGDSEPYGSLPLTFLVVMSEIHRNLWRWAASVWPTVRAKKILPSGGRVRQTAQSR